jgi:hypothetical protein
METPTAAGAPIQSCKTRELFGLVARKGNSASIDDTANYMETISNNDFTVPIWDCGLKVAPQTVSRSNGLQRVLSTF